MSKKEKGTVLALILIFLFSILVGCSTTEVSKKESEQENTETQEEKEDDEVWELTTAQVNLLQTPYNKMTELDIEACDLVVRYQHNYGEYDAEIIEKYRENVNDALAEESNKDRMREAEAKKERYETGITRDDLARDRDGLLNAYVKFTGTIIQVMEYENITEYRMAVDDDYDQVILIEISNYLLDYNILEDDVITIEGKSIGNITYETTLGEKVKLPAVSVDRFY